MPLVCIREDFLEELTFELSIKEEEADGEPDEMGGKVEKRGENTF